LPQGFCFPFPAAEVLIEVDHQLRRRVVFEFPERRYNTLRSGFDERIHDVRNSFLADRTNACIAGGERYQACIERQLSDFAQLKKPVVDGRRLRCEHQSRAVRVFRISVSMQSKMNDVVLIERKSLEGSLCGILAQENCAGLR